MLQIRERRHGSRPRVDVYHETVVDRQQHEGQHLVVAPRHDADPVARPNVEELG